MIDVNARQFRDAVKMVGRCVERRNTIPILDSIKVAVNSKMEITGTDLDLTMQVALPCEPTAGYKRREGTFLIENFRYVNRAVSAAGGDTATFALGDSQYRVVAGDLSLAMKNQCAVQDWPVDQSAVMVSAWEASLSADQLAQIGRVSAAISTEETRYYLNGVYFHHLSEWTWRAVATDGHRLMYVDLQLPDAMGKTDGVIIPRKALRVALETLKASKDGVALAIGDGRIVNREETTAPKPSALSRIRLTGAVGGLGIQLSTKTIDGTYPDYRRVIPHECPIRVLMPVQKLRQAIHAVSGAFGKTPAIKLTLVRDGIEVRAAHAPEGGEAMFRCAAQHSGASDNFWIGFNGQYLLDCLNALRGTDVALGLTDSAGPAVIRDPADTVFGAVLMPMRV